MLEGVNVHVQACAVMAQLETSYESDGYDGTWGDSVWWFESWGTGSKANWTIRGNVNRPPTPSELRSADYIVIGIRRASGEVIYRTRTHPLDLDPRLRLR